MFQKKWAAVKQSNKERLAHYVESTLGLKINTHAMFDVQVKVRFMSLFFLLPLFGSVLDVFGRRRSADPVEFALV